ncbi:MAG: carbohydrate binding domain-containing protein, partial [Clostridia bacterium]
ANLFHEDKGIKFDSQRKFGNLLVGSTKGNQRPKIVLKDNSTIKDNTLLLFRYYDPRVEDVSKDRGKHYLATIRGIDIDMGDNPSVSAISMAGAQYCTIQDVTITGKSFYAGLHKIPGAVGSVINVKVSGGDIGVLSDSYVPEALVAGIVLENQKKYGVKIVDSRNSPVTLVGFKIVSPAVPSTAYRAVYADDRGAIEERGEQRRAHVALVDGTIEVKGKYGKAIESYDQYVIMSNVYVKANTIINTGIKLAPTERVQGDANNWKHVQNYAFVPKSNNGYIHVNGKEYANKNQDVQYYNQISKQQPGEDFIQKHSWPVQMPAYDDPDKVNVVTDYGATPESVNNNDDDAIAIQKAIDDTTTVGNPNYGKKVFLPRGHFHIKSGITLKKGTKLFGAGKNISVIHQSPSFKTEQYPYMMVTVENSEANIIMSDFALLRQQASESEGMEAFKQVSMLRIRGDHTVFRDVQLAAVEGTRDNYYVKPEVVFSGEAGGKIYNLAVNTDVKTEAGGNIHGEYRRVLIDNVTNPLTIYQCGVNNTEKAYNLEINDSANISIFALKFEEQNQLLKIKDSVHVSITGGYGYYTIVDNIDAIITIENSKDIMLAGIGRSSMKKYDEREGKKWISNGKDFLMDDYDIILYRAANINPLPKKDELMKNGDFEAGVTDWKAKGNAKIKEEQDHVHQGTKAVKITNRKAEDDGIEQDITSILKKNGPGTYQVSAWIMNDNSEGGSKKESSSKATIKVKLKYDGITKSFTVGDTAHPYWNRINGELKLSWKKLESAKISIENNNQKTDYYLDEMSVYKTR